MAIFELDSTMLKKLDKLHSACNTLNSMKKQTEASYQINHERVIICVHKSGDWDFPLYTYQRSFVQLTYQDLDEALAEITYYQKYNY